MRLVRMFYFLPPLDTPCYVIFALNNLFAQPADLGAHPQIFAALNQDLKGGELIGPKFISFSMINFFTQLTPVYKFMNHEKLAVAGP